MGVGSSQPTPNCDDLCKTYRRCMAIALLTGKHCDQPSECMCIHITSKVNQDSP